MARERKCHGRWAATQGELVFEQAIFLFPPTPPFPRFLRSPARTRERAPQKSKMALDYRTERVFRDETPSNRLQAGGYDLGRIMQIGTPVKFSRQPGTKSEQ